MLEPVFESTEEFTPEAFASFVDEHATQGDIHRYELLNGRIVMNPPAGWPHGNKAALLGARFTYYVEAHKLGYPFDSSQGFELPSGDVVAPDFAFVSHAQWQTFQPPVPGKFLKGVPTLVVEILSPKTASTDRGEKRGIYERNGVEEYWLVDIRANRITVLSLSGGKYQVSGQFDVDASAQSRVLEGFELHVNELFPQ